MNPGAEGQLLWGALVAAWVGHGVSAPGFIHIPLALAAGAGAGALWAWPAAALKCRRGAPEVVTTLLLTFIAANLTTYLAANPLHDPTQQGPRTADVFPTAALLTFTPTRAHLGTILALLTAGLLALVIQRGRFGFQLRVVGRNPEAARSSNISVSRTWTAALLGSGALAGLAGAVEVLAVHHYFQREISPGYGFEGIAVAILGNNTPGGVVAAALFLGALANGAVQMESDTGISKFLVSVIQALVVLAVAVRRWPSWRRHA
jgi:general nucleoside transport system permease protein